MVNYQRGLILLTYRKHKEHRKIHKSEDILEAMEITEQLAAQLGFPRTEILHLQLVTEEACTNAYEYITSVGQGSFSISWKVINEELEIVLQQKGGLYQLEAVPSKLGGVRGRGLMIIKGIMDEVRLVEKNHHVELYMKKIKRCQ